MSYISLLCSEKILLQYSVHVTLTGLSDVLLMEPSVLKFHWFWIAVSLVWKSSSRTFFSILSQSRMDGLVESSGLVLVSIVSSMTSNYSHNYSSIIYACLLLPFSMSLPSQSTLWMLLRVKWWSSHAGECTLPMMSLPSQSTPWTSGELQVCGGSFEFIP